MRIALLILATCIWGAGFAGTRWTLEDYSPLWSNSLRFLVAGSLCLPLLLIRRKIRNYVGVVVASLFLLLGLLLQTYGLEHTTLAKSGFLTAFYALFTPLFSYWLYGSQFRPTYWVLLGLALVGIAMLCDFHWDGFNVGDAYTLASAVFFSLHILAIDRFSQNENAIDFNLGQCVFLGIFGMILGYLLEGPPDFAPLFRPEALEFPSSLYGFAVVGVFSSLIAFTIQVYAQKGTRPHIVALIFLLESVFSAWFGYLFFQETLTWMALGGAILVLLAVGLTPIWTDFAKNEGHPH